MKKYVANLYKNAFGASTLPRIIDMKWTWSQIESASLDLSLDNMKTVSHQSMAVGQELAS